MFIFFQNKQRWCRDFSPIPQAVRGENSVHNSKCRRAGRCGFFSAGLQLLFSLTEPYIKAWGDRTDFCFAAWRIADYSDSPWHLDTAEQFKMLLPMNSRRFLISPFKTDLSHNAESSLKVGIMPIPLAWQSLLRTQHLCAGTPVPVTLMLPVKQWQILFCHQQQTI